MKALEEFAATFKRDVPKKVKKPRIWKEKDVLDGKIVDAFVVILRTVGCKWAHESGCLMCGYFKETYDAGKEEILKQVEEAYSHYNGEEIVKIFTSGSFLDSEEIPLELQEFILNKFARAKKIIVESRPEFIENLERIKAKARLEVAMGLESANDRVLEYSINKGFTFAEWRKAAEKVKEYGKELKVYILIKPPFLTEKDAIEDAVRSVEKVKDIADTISFNPVAIHSKTLVELLWRKKLYSPPWLWSVVKVIEEATEIYDGLIKCDVVAGGKARGAHNCGKCDAAFIKAIRDFSLSQKIDALKKLECECREEWLDLLEIEEFLKG
ncbi:MAG TPA: TIGR01210 family radical SAM protein [Thermoplasmatales archaeon]|nr:TIGR01210 family radical SAM protein [Thermoplasmatales archaeon]